MNALIDKINIYSFLLQFLNSKMGADKSLHQFVDEDGSEALLKYEHISAIITHRIIIRLDGVARLMTDPQLTSSTTL